MKKFIGAVFALSLLCSCVSPNNQDPDKVTKIKAELECKLNVLKPFISLFTLDTAAELLSGHLDLVETLQAVEIEPSDIINFVKDWNSCKP
jgi:hypothetical protein